MLSRVKILENVGFSFQSGRTKTEVFKYDDYIYHNTVNPLLRPPGGLIFSNTFEGGGGA